MDETKYYCEKCNFNTNYMSHWNEHLESNKHNGKKRKERSDKILVPKCSHCNYETNKTSNMKLHTLTHHSTPQDRKQKFKHYCDNCDFGTDVQILFSRHLETQKHTNANPAK